MTCREARDYQSDYLDGALPVATQGQLAQHLDGCAACQEEYRLLTNARRLLATYGAMPCPVDMTHLATQRSLRSGARWFLPSLRGRLAMASFAVTLVFVGWQWQRSPVSPPPPQRMPPQLVVRDVAEVEEIHASFAVQQSLQGRDGLLLFAPDWGERER
jgi:anti-sigma factor RsiW